MSKIARSDEYGQCSGGGREAPDAHVPSAVAGLPEGDPVTHVSAGICHSAAQMRSEVNNFEK